MRIICLVYLRFRELFFFFKFFYFFKAIIYLFIYLILGNVGNLELLPGFGLVLILSNV